MRYKVINRTDEAYLVERCKNNDQEAQEFLFDQHIEGMMVLCLRYIADREDAKEVAMDSFFNFFKNINSFTYQGAGSTKAWLKKITVNNCISHLRKRKLVFSTANDMTQYEDVRNDSNAIDEMNIKEIMKLIHSLPDGYRTVFNLYVFEGMNHREIGEMLGISDNTSKSQLYKAREMLKKQILQTS